MSNLDRRKLLQYGIAMSVPLGGFSLFGKCQQSTNTGHNEDSPQSSGSDESKVKPEQEEKEDTMQIQYLEIVTPEDESLCKQYSAIHGITFSEPIPGLGNARTAKFNGGGLIAIRGPLRETETPVIRPYTLVEDLEKAVAAAANAGAEIALPSMEIPGHGTIAVVIHGGIECGLWQSLK